MTDGTLGKLKQSTADAMDTDAAMRYHVTQLSKLLGLPHKGDNEASEEQAVDPVTEAEQGQSSEVYISTEDKIISCGLTMLGWDEEEHREGLMRAFGDAGILGPDGKTLDPDTTAWCGGWVDLIFNLVGLPMVHSLRAKDFYEIGTMARLLDGEHPRPAMLACWRNHVAFVIGYASQAIKITDMKQWNKLETTHSNGFLMVLGGNQSDGVNISPASWYSQYSEFIGYRWLSDEVTS